jgi:membrane-associated phospholipid phosphatase
MKAQRLLEADASRSLALRIPEASRQRRRLAAVFAHSGDSWFWLLGLALAWILGDAAAKAWALHVAAAICLLAVTVQVLKQLVRRPRPEGEWGQIYRATDPHSFPSGHAARAFLLAALVAGWGPPWLVPVLLVWAPLVCLARVALGVHFLSDVLVGGFIGLGIGLTAASLFPI